MRGLLAQVLPFLQYLLRRFVRNQGVANAASLTFTTLLSLVPLMAVSLAVVSLLSISDQIYVQIQAFVFDNFVPAAGAVLQNHLAQFSAKAAQMTGPGFLFLLVVALMMMASIDRAFNNIWQVKKKRAPMALFVVYWAILSLGPLLIGLSVVVSSYLITIPLFSGVTDEWVSVSKFLIVAPTVASMAAFSLLYLVVPNRRVPIKYALMGGLLAALLFELTKRGFALYITQFPTYEAIYGALSAVPIFLIWIYLSWIITLLGAEFTYCLEYFEYECQVAQTKGADKIILHFQLLQQLWLNQQTGDTASLRQLSNSLRGVPEGALEAGLMLLQRENLVVCSEVQQWALCHDLSKVSVWDLLCLTENRLPEPDLLLCSDDTAVRKLGHLLQTISIEVSELTSVSLDEFLSESPARHTV